MNKSTTLARGLFLSLRQFSKLLLLTAIATSFSLQGQNNFNKEKDLFIAQFDSYPDTDDVHAQAAVGSLLAHPDFQGVNYLGVAGAYGDQVNSSKSGYIDTNSLFEMGFGAENDAWVDAHNKYSSSVDLIVNKAKSILNAGGKVWVMEAGQSNITADWIAELIEDGVSNTKTNVIVVQHSDWNESKTNASDLAYVKSNANYVRLDDGNDPYDNPRADEGDNTPDYEEASTSYLNQILGNDNPNSYTKDLWAHADEISDTSTYNYGVIPGGGIDFSDTVEAMWIFDKNHDYRTVQSFIDEFILYEVNETCNVYEEINGIVAVEAEHFVSQSKTEHREWFIIGDGSITPSPDPDGPNTATASGGMYLEILPDTRVTHDDPIVDGVSFTNSGGTIAVIDYKVYINNPGKYFVWVRAHSSGTEDNGIHVGLDGTWPSTGNKMQWCDGKNQWTWESKQRTDANHCGVEEQIYLDIDTAGEHTISFSMREDGFEFDKFILSKAYTKPTNEGIAEVSNDCDNDNPVTDVIAIPGSFEAEDYSSISGVIRKESTPGTTGENLGYIKNGDTVEYAIDVAQTGLYSLDLYASSFGAGGIVNIYSDNSLLDAINVSVNGEWHNYEVYGTTVNLNAGEQTLKLVFNDASTDYLMNLDKVVVTQLSVASITIPGSFEAENYENIAGSVRVESTPGTTGENLGYIKNNDTAEYAVNVTQSGAYTFNIYASSEGAGGTVNIYSNNALLATTYVAVNGTWHDYQVYEATANLNSGEQTIKLVFSDASTDYLMNLDKLIVTKEESTLAQTTELSPINDAYLQGATRYNDNNIRIENGNRVGYLMFDLSEIDGAIETLDLEFTIFSDSGNGNVNVNLGTSNSWTETNLSTSNSPDVGGLLGSLNTTFALGNTYSISLDASQITGDSLTLILTATSGNDFDFGSKENSGTTGPKLVINDDSANKGITLTSGATIEIYPNPVVDVINFKGNVDGAVVKVYSLLGALQTEVSLESGQESLNVSNLAPGVYIVNITNVTNGQLVSEMIKAIKQ